MDKFAAVQMLDVHFPTTDGRTLALSRHTELNPDQKLLVRRGERSASRSRPISGVQKSWVRISIPRRQISRP